MRKLTQMPSLNKKPKNKLSPNHNQKNLLHRPKKNNRPNKNKPTNPRPRHRPRQKPRKTKTYDHTKLIT